MSLLPFLAVTVAGAVLATALRGHRRAGTVAGFAGVGAALVALILTEPGAPLTIGGEVVAMTAYARVLLGAGLAGGLLVLAVSRLATWEASGPAALLVATAGLAVALGVGGAVTGLAAAGRRRPSPPPWLSPTRPHPCGCAPWPARSGAPRWRWRSGSLP